MLNYQSKAEFLSDLKSRFIFCYSAGKMNWLRHHNFKYICKGMNEITSRPFWLFDRTEAISDCLIKYKEFLYNSESIDIEEF
jgi:hypothetical protein